MTTLTPYDAAAELLRRKMARKNLGPFAGYILNVRPAIHHLLICDHIERLLNDEWDELIILAPPGSAKSYYTSIALPPFAMGTSPTPINVLTASYSAELAEKWGRRVRNIVGTEEFGALYPHIRLSEESKAAGRWATSRGDELYAAGVGGGILGFRADLGIIDDPISGFEQAQSLSQLQKVHSWYETDFVTRMKPNAKLVLICQRLARNDLAGYLIDRNIENPTKRQKVLVLKMEAEGDDPLGREPGERLWPDWFTREMVIDAKRDEFKWKTLYQQSPPSEEGSWVSPSEIQFRPTPQITEETVTYGCSDLALSVNSGDYTVHFVVAIDSNGDWDIVDASRERVDVEESSTRVVNFCETYSPMEWLIDDDNASKVFMPLVASKARHRGVFVPWKPIPMRGQDKETRAAPLRGMFKRRKIYMPKDAPFTKWLLNEIFGFPNLVGQGVDDGIDALSTLGRRMLALAKPASNEKVVVKGKTWQDMTLNEMWEDRERQFVTRRRI